MTSSRHPLDGVRVLDLSRLLPGGFCSQLLADLGADVVKVEDTGVGDYVRIAPPYYDGDVQSTRSALFLAVNRNKRSIQLNLKTGQGREALLALVADADVLLESFRPGVLERIGVGYEVLADRNPGIVYCSITGYGLDGPNVARSGHDINYLALSGLLALSGDGDAPVSCAGQIADLGGGALMAVAGILAALRERDGTPAHPGSGVGQVVDVSMFDGALSWLALPAAQALCEGRSQRRGEFMLGGAIVCYRPYRCADGWVAIGAIEPKFWAAWCDGVGHPELIAAQFEAPGSDAHREIERIFAQRTGAQWAEFASVVDCCLEPELDQPGIETTVRVIGSPLKLSRTPADTTARPAPALGEHTRELLAEAGYEPAHIETLLAAGAAAEAGATTAA
jgi:alpha-methylacyl-CoA racemase